MMDEHQEPIAISNVNGDLVSRFFSYPFDTDEVYQVLMKQGIAGIINNAGFSDRTESQQEHIILSSKVFYFNRISDQSITVEDVLRARNAGQDSHAPRNEVTSQGADPSRPTEDGGVAETRILSFAELKALIEQGKTDEIPNNRVIPDVLNNETPSESRAAIRRKPWEMGAQDAAVGQGNVDH
ncbi:hypothetical protein NM688_g1379 [Phlebia brevispora]|uniref:Uncharacterized protein n=1 Tax=Phlebia brevispora TaxID=194682 RepID=A0ACC1TBG1_9APHY|nr:hypothetical protein NM688_g1379 [Phlebia brevispora]